jgi:L-lactate dehydrogenase
MSEPNARKVAIVGAGSVGATIAYACLIRGIAKEVALYDVDRDKVDAEVLDLNHGLQFVPTATVQGSDDVAVCAGADVVVIAAGAKQKPTQSRMDLLSANATLFRRLVPQLISAAPEATYVVVSNPVDVLTYAALELSGLPRARVLGSGTVLDSSRFRFLIARRCRVAVQNVHAYIVGEHGDSEVPLWSSATIANIPLHEWSVAHHGHLTVRDRTEIFQNVKTADGQIIQGKGATSYAIALAVARILEALLHDENRVLPVCSVPEAFLDFAGICLSLPCIVNAAGAEPPLPVKLSANEESGLRNSAALIQSAVRAAGF